MRMSNIQAVGFALNPGSAEALERNVIRSGNMAWDGMSKGIKHARNAFYTLQTDC